MLSSLFSVAYYLAQKNVVLNQAQIKLPKPKITGNISIEAAISKRKTYRVFSSKSISLAELSQLLWAAQGITHDNYLRAAPSAGATYPLELFVIVRNMKGLEPGTYHYRVTEHALEKHSNQTFDQELFNLAFKQQSVKNAKLIIVVAADFKRTEKKYHQYASPYVWMEAGHATQNMMLEGVSIGVGMVSIGGFKYKNVSKLMNLGQFQPLYLVCMGKI